MFNYPFLNRVNVWIVLVWITTAEGMMIVVVTSIAKTLTGAVEFSMEIVKSVTKHIHGLKLLLQSSKSPEGFMLYDLCYTLLIYGGTEVTP